MKRPQTPPRADVFSVPIQEHRAPITRAWADRMALADATVDALAAAHRIEPWLARLLVRPMLADLTARGRWMAAAGLYVVRELEEARRGDRLCHALAVDVAHRQVVDYQAGHAAAVCRRRPRRPPLETPTWLSGSCAPPTGGREAVWRYLLRTSSGCPAHLTVEALRTFTGEHSQPLAPGRLPQMYTAAAACLLTVAPLLPREPGCWLLHDGARRWDLQVTARTAKPVVTAVHRQPTVRPQVTRIAIHQPRSPASARGV
ncbi:MULTISPECIES: hypothetical protein [Streptomyces]|uniref:hypothetical protein n=1 Tax=Streptomyces TaxID=1883 RepID=UPI0004CD7BE2|nr:MULTISPECIES: hypothetical protein [Streptomyces]KOT52695.1 hypothetical protein ADK43_29980 [Streptomyces rimosus subsp. rimosus]